MTRERLVPPNGMKPPPLGAGIYSPTDAARLLRLSPDRLRRWMAGYTYHARASGSRRRVRPVFGRASHGADDRDSWLTFVELIELRVAIALRESGLSLQQIRSAATFAIKSFRTDHPFATRHLFTDGKSILASTGPDLAEDAIVELTPERDTQLQFARGMTPLVKGLEFAPGTGIARRWRPNGQSGLVLLDPEICLGAPVVEGTRIRSSLVAGVAIADSPGTAARLFELTERQVAAAVRFEVELDER